MNEKEQKVAAEKLVDRVGCRVVDTCALLLDQLADKPATALLTGPEALRLAARAFRSQKGFNKDVA